ncbi:hypothetical protein ES702_06059 [subsurface metagenome]
MNRGKAVDKGGFSGNIRKKEMRRIIKLFALVCYTCPLCIVARRFPESRFAKWVKNVSKICPFCIAYRRSNPLKDFINKEG